MRVPGVPRFPRLEGLPGHGTGRPLLEAGGEGRGRGLGGWRLLLAPGWLPRAVRVWQGPGGGGGGCVLDAWRTRAELLGLDAEGATRKWPLCFVCWLARVESNHRPLPCQPDAWLKIAPSRMRPCSRKRLFSHEIRPSLCWSLRDLPGTEYGHVVDTGTHPPCADGRDQQPPGSSGQVCPDRRLFMIFQGRSYRLVWSLWLILWSDP
jgi:hypothetical protein